MVRNFKFQIKLDDEIENFNRLQLVWYHGWYLVQE